MSDNEKTLGHFLTYEIWQDALRLLNAQIDAQNTNKHFKTLSMIYYKKLGGAINDLQKPEFFEGFVKNNLFYGMESEFGIYPYIIPKTGLGIRKYKFFTYPMKAVYIAIGLYMFRLSTEFLTNYYWKSQNIRSYYGGGLYFESNSLVITKNNIYFSSYYRNFRNELRKEINSDKDNKVVIRIDVQNYYDEISIPTLLEQFELNYKDSEKANLRFDTTTKEQIEFFFRHLGKDQRGIPQSDNSIISSIIGYLYLVFGDLLIDGELRKDREIIDRYKIIRYVDDIFVSIKFKDNIDNNKQKEYIESIGSRISDSLFFQFGLRLNPKTRFFWLSIQEHLDDLTASLRKISPQYYSAPEDIEEESIDNKVNNIFDELKKLKESSIEPETFKHEISDEIFKEVFDIRVNQILEKKENKRKISDIFDNFNFNRVKEYPLPIIIIILKEQSVADKFREYLLQERILTSKDVDLMLTYLCQIDFSDIKILESLKKHRPMKEIISKVINPDLSYNQPGYYGLNNNQIQRLSSIPNVIEQIRLRVFNERIGSYSVALNHLLNELHGICYQIDGNKCQNNDYDVNQVIKFLQGEGVSHTTCIGVRKLFDRRNTNQISHPGSANYLAWSVSQSEYWQYHKIVSDCLGVLIN